MKKVHHGDNTAMTHPQITVDQYRERARKATTPEEALAVAEGIRLLLEREFNDDLYRLGLTLATKHKLEVLRNEFLKWQSSPVPKIVRPNYGPSVDTVEQMEDLEELERLRLAWSEESMLHPDSVKFAFKLGAVLFRLDKREEAREVFLRALALSQRSDLSNANPQSFDAIRHDIQGYLAALNADRNIETRVSSGNSPSELLAPPTEEQAPQIAEPLSELARSPEASKGKQLGRLVFSSRFMSRPKIERIVVEASQLAGPVAIFLDSFDIIENVPIEFLQRNRRIAWRSVCQLANLPSSLRCPVVREEDGTASLFVGAWLVPLSIFGPGTALSAEHKAIMLYPQTHAALWEECRLEPLANDEGWIEGWFFAVNDPQNPGRRLYGIRTRHGGWIRWEYMSFARKCFMPPRIGDSVRFKLRTSGKSSTVVATELDLEQVSEASRIFNFPVLRFTNAPPSLLAGAIALPVFPELQLREDEGSIDVCVTLYGKGNWTVARPGQVVAIRPDVTRSPVVAAVQRCMSELGQPTEENGNSFELALADLETLPSSRWKVSRATEEYLAHEVARIARSTGAEKRLPGLSRVLAVVLGVAARKGQGEKRDAWRARWSLVMTHLLAGEARVYKEHGRLRVGDDPVSAVLAQHPDFSLYSGFLGENGPALCLTLVELGNLGYRLVDLKLYSGCSSLDLIRTSSAVDDRLPISLRLVAQYGRTDAAHSIVRELLRAAPVGSARALVFCVEDPSAPGIGRYTAASKAVAILESAAYDCPSAISEPDWARKLAENALSYLQFIPNPTSAFAEEARSLSPTQFIPRPALLADLQNALEARQEALGVFSMRKAGKTATATLLSTTFRFDHHYVNLGEELGRTTDEELDALIRGIDEKLSTEQRKPLLILDEFDTFCRHLGDRPRSIALRFLKWLEDHARKHPVLCVGLDPTALASVYPESNPLQTLRLFQLPYFNLEESREFAAALGRQLVVPEKTVVRAFTLSGGHPVVMLNLFHFSLCAGLNFPSSSQFVPRDTVVDFTDELWTAIQSEFGAPLQDPNLSRYQALTRVLETQKSTYPSIHDPWLVAQRLSELPGDTYSMETVAAITREILRASALDPSRSPAELVAQLLRWGLLRRTLGEDLEFGIPLLRVELTGGKWKCRCPN